MMAMKVFVERASVSVRLFLLVVTLNLIVAGAHGGCPSILPSACNCATRIENLQEITSVKCVGKGLADTPLFTYQANRSVHILDLRRNELTSIANYAFDGLYGVRILWLDQNQISTIASNAFSAISSTLQQLHLNYNQLPRIPVNGLKVLTKLQRLELRYNKIVNLGLTDLEGLNELKHLDLQSNDISAIAEAQFSKFPNLGLLSLGENRIADLPTRAFEGIENLTSLSLSDNLLTETPLDTYERLRQLEIFDFNRNRISELNVALFQRLTGLRNIYGSGNNLERIERGTFDNLHSLTTLDLSNNRFHTLASDTFNGLAMSLVTLNLMNNNLTEDSVLPAIHSLTNLQRLLLSGNAFQILGANAFQSLSKLKELFLARNNIRRVNNSAFSGLEESLEVLHLEHNRLLELPYLKNLTNLREFYFGGNALGVIPKRAFDGLELTRLDLSQTNITSKLASLPPEAFQGLEEYLENLDLHGNFLETVHHCVFGRLKRLKILDISFNPLSCDCRMLWLHLTFRDVTYNRARCDRSANKGESWEESSAIESFTVSGCSSDEIANCTDPPVPSSTNTPTSQPPPGDQPRQLAADKDTVVVIVLVCVCGLALLAVIVGFICSCSQRRRVLKNDFPMSDTSSTVYSTSSVFKR
ncbi:insulin-like growth factor-binding protein complex acid labile subunit [Lingula anatina]|uniref:Insulin-like growth factor-binding protein complex acid labile subunit n=1 Tax=Lingula anatina TaxID=7574 RepID=A0A1S3HQY7_LINAN|nr:insulin-like growth factor-binding protein complex acid labile subunit [Lingula anatina]|eukprot:XP_013388468.2 insulin-like growth factor-binding protein complex acid labile subunit [Lingula anatina]